jgi:formylglycine-generating enzyme required for sulfatase activity
MRLSNGPGPGVELVRLPPGKVVLKDAAGKDVEHAIKPVWMARYETRIEEYEIFFDGLDLPEAGGVRSARKRERTTRPYPPPGRSMGPDDDWDGVRNAQLPVGSATLAAAKKYCAWLSENTGRRFRLPTEAEWSYACRAGGAPARPDARTLDRVAWTADNVGGPQVKASPGIPGDLSVKDGRHAVGRKDPNAWGLYDMLGNVAEYVIRDPKDERGLVAGGSYLDAAKGLLCETRHPYSPEWQMHDPQDPKDQDWLWYIYHVGFRVVMEE